MIPQDTALRQQLAIIAGDEPDRSYIEVRWRRREGMGQSFHRCRRIAELVDVIESIGRMTDVYVGVAPRVARRGKGDAVARAWCLWADCDSEKSVDRLRAFRPLPSLVIRSGSIDGSTPKVHAYWPLSHPLLRGFAKAANRRLAKHLEADMTAAEVARILRPAGTLNHKHAPPRAVECVLLTRDRYRAPQVIGKLKDDPAMIPRPKPRPGPPPAETDSKSVIGVLRVASEAPNGERNSRLFWAACRLGEKVVGGGLSDASATELLRSAAAASGLSDDEPGTTERTIRSGLDTGGTTCPLG